MPSPSAISSRTQTLPNANTTGSGTWSTGSVATTRLLTGSIREITSARLLATQTESPAIAIPLGP